MQSNQASIKMKTQRVYEMAESRKPRGLRKHLTPEDLVMGDEYNFNTKKKENCYKTPPPRPPQPGASCLITYS